MFTGARGDYQITTLAGVTTVVDLRGGTPDGTDSVSGVETFRFADGDIAAASVNDIAGTPGRRGADGRSGGEPHLQQWRKRYDHGRGGADYVILSGGSTQVSLGGAMTTCSSMRAART